MIEFLTLTVFIGYLIYLKKYADQRTDAEKEADRLREGITLYETGEYANALAYFNNVLETHPMSAVGYLYRARIYRALGDPQAALTDLNRGKSYDDTVSELHIESGQIQYEAQEYATASQDFDKAIFHAHGDTAEPYRWRGLTRQHLQQPVEADQDLAKAAQLAERLRTQTSVQPPVNRAFVDRQLLLNAGLTVLTSVILVYIVKKSPVIHWPYLWAAASAVGIGFIEPRKGWMLAILRAFLIVFGYYVVAGPDPLSTHREVEGFSLYGSVILTFAGSLIGSVLRKAQAK